METQAYQNTGTTRRRWLRELRRRGVPQTAASYAIVSLGVLEWLEAVDMPPEAVRILAMIAALGFPVAVALSWLFRITLESSSGSSAEWAENDHRPLTEGPVTPAIAAWVVTIMVVLVPVFTTLLVWRFLG